MSEYTILHTAVASFLFCVLAAWFYGLGGRSNKWLRRFVASGIFTLGFNLCALWLGKWEWWMPLVWLGMAPIYIKGYAGGSGPSGRVIKRLIIWGMLTALGIVIAFALHLPLWKAVIALGIQMWVCLPTLAFAVKNPYYAAFEEPFICVITSVPIMGYLFI